MEMRKLTMMLQFIIKSVLDKLTNLWRLGMKIHEELVLFEEITDIVNCLNLSLRIFKRPVLIHYFGALIVVIHCLQQTGFEDARICRHYVIAAIATEALLKHEEFWIITGA